MIKKNSKEYEKTLSIIIVNYNTAEMTTECIHSIHKHHPDRSYEIIVVDNDSKDNSCALLRKTFPEIAILRQEKNLGYASAINKGLQFARGEYVLILNSDTLWVEDAVTEPINYLRHNPDVGALGCKLVNMNGSLQQSIYYHPSLTRELMNAFGISPIIRASKVLSTVVKHAFFFMPKSRLGRIGSHDELAFVEGIKGAYILTTKTLLLKTYGFDENIFMYGEETEWFIRIRKLGYTIAYFPYVRIIHLGRGSDHDRRISPTFTSRYVSLKYIFSKHRSCYYVSVFQAIALFAILCRMAMNEFMLAVTSEKWRNKYSIEYLQTVKMIIDNGRVVGKALQA